jgi:ParB-like chromosome segregation protein Spo0J
MAKRVARGKTEQAEPEGYSQEQVARIVGCAQSTVSRMIKRGDVETLTSGRLPEAAIEVIRAQWRDEEKANEETASLERRLRIAETEKQEALAKLKTMEVERETGRFVELDAVERAGSDAAERILGVLRAIPQRTAMALECGCRSGAIVEAKIREEVERAIGEMRESLYLQVKKERQTKRVGRKKRAA